MQKLIPCRTACCLAKSLVPGTETLPWTSKDTGRGSDGMTESPGLAGPGQDRG